MYAMKFFEVQNNLTLTGHLYSPWPVIISQNFFDGLTEDLQNVVMDAAIETRDYNRQLSLEDEANSLDLLKAEGMAVVDLTEEHKKEFQDAMRTVYGDVKAEVGEEIYDKLMKEVGM